MVNPLLRIASLLRCRNLVPMAYPAYKNSLRVLTHDFFAEST